MKGGNVSRPQLVSDDFLSDGAIIGLEMSPHFAIHDYGLSEKASRQWVVDNSDPDEWLGEVPIPLDHRDGHVTHATYDPECEHGIDEECRCADDETVQWTLTAYSG